MRIISFDTTTVYLLYTGVRPSMPVIRGSSLVFMGRKFQYLEGFFMVV
jgi:hypothetical protein